VPRLQRDCMGFFGSGMTARGLSRLHAPLRCSLPFPLLVTCGMLSRCVHLDKVTLR